VIYIFCHYIKGINNLQTNDRTMKIPPFKMMITSTNRSRTVQQFLFNQGYSWEDGTQRIFILDGKFLFFNGKHLRYTVSNSEFTNSTLDRYTWSHFRADFLDKEIIDEVVNHYDPYSDRFWIKVSNHKESKTIQKLLFAMGIFWMSDRTSIHSPLGISFLSVTGASISYGCDDAGVEIKRIAESENEFSFNEFKDYAYNKIDIIAKNKDDK
jgi:hypothetical protein